MPLQHQDFAEQLQAVRRALSRLPQVVEREHSGGPAFCVNGRMFARFWMKEGRWIIQLPHTRQMMLFDARPETFAPMRSGRMVWSDAKIGDIGAGELADLLKQAWREVAPAKYREGEQQS